MFFFFNDTATTEIYTLSLHDALPILITGPGGTPQAMGVSVQPSSDGSNWIVTVLSTPTGKLYASTTLAIFHGDGTSNMSATAFASRSEERRVGKECRSRWSPYH